MVDHETLRAQLRPSRDRHDPVALDLARGAWAALLVRIDADPLLGQPPLNRLLTLDPAAFRAWLPPIG